MIYISSFVETTVAAAGGSAFEYHPVEFFCFADSLCAIVRMLCIYIRTNSVEDLAF